MYDCCVQVGTREVLLALNGAVVGLLVSGTSAATHADATAGGSAACSSDPAGVKRNLRVLPTMPLSRCIGLGVVRSIDTVQRVFYIATPVPVEELSAVDVIVRGAIQLPGIALFQVWVCLWPVCVMVLGISASLW